MSITSTSSYSFTVFVAKKRKNRNLGPQTKRMKLQARLHSAKSWIPTFLGKNIVKGYRNRYAVDDICAIKELKILGVKLNPEYILQLKISAEATAQSKRKTKEKIREDSLPYDSDEDFAYIAGYTEGGAPYGITWEDSELEEPESEGSDLEECLKE